MTNLQEFWNKNSARIPDDKGCSMYAVEKERQFPRNSAMCDLGGGTGTDSIYFAQKGHDVVLTDIADEPLAKAEIRAEELGLAGNVKTVQCDFSLGVLPFQDTSFDIVYSRLALHYFESKTLSRLFAEIYRILREGGQTFLTLKSPDDTAEMAFLAKTAKEIEDGVFDEDGRTKTRYTIDQLEHMLADAHIPNEHAKVVVYTEKLGNSNDIVKSGSEAFIVNQIIITK